jgi:hypothetical protein
MATKAKVKEIEANLHEIHLSTVGGINHETLSEYCTTRFALYIEPLTTTTIVEPPPNIFYEDIVQIVDARRRHGIMENIRRLKDQSIHADTRVNQRGNTRRGLELITMDTTMNISNQNIPLYHIINIKDIQIKKLKLIDNQKDGKCFELESIKFTVTSSRKKGDASNPLTYWINLLDAAVDNYNTTRFNSQDIKSKLFQIFTEEKDGFECDVFVDFYKNISAPKVEINSIIPLTFDSRETAQLLYDNVKHVYLVRNHYFLFSGDERKLITYVDYDNNQARLEKQERNRDKQERKRLEKQEKKNKK